MANSHRIFRSYIFHNAHMFTIEEEIQRIESGEIDFLEFVLDQESLAEEYLQDVLSKGITPTAQNAEDWLKKYENENLYQ